MRLGLWIITIIIELAVFYWLSNNCIENWKVTIAILAVALINYIQGIERGSKE